MLLLPDAKNCAVLPKQLAQVHRAEGRSPLPLLVIPLEATCTSAQSRRNPKSRTKHDNREATCTSAQSRRSCFYLTHMFSERSNLHKCTEQKSAATNTGDHSAAKQLAQVHRAEGLGDLAAVIKRRSNLHKCTEQKHTSTYLNCFFSEATCTSAQSRSKVSAYSP